MFPELKLHPLLLIYSIQTLDMGRFKNTLQHLTFSIHKQHTKCTEGTSVTLTYTVYDTRTGVNTHENVEKDGNTQKDKVH